MLGSGKARRESSLSGKTMVEKTVIKTDVSARAVGACATGRQRRSVSGNAVWGSRKS